MKIVWSLVALADRTEITDYMLLEYRVQAAKKQSDLIRDSVKMLADFPFSGRAGLLPGTYEKVCKGTPYIVVYEIRDNVVRVLRLYHGSRKMPLS